MFDLSYLKVELIPHTSREVGVSRQSLEDKEGGIFRFQCINPTSNCQWSGSVGGFTKKAFERGGPELGPDSYRDGICSVDWIFSSRNEEKGLGGGYAD